MGLSALASVVSDGCFESKQNGSVFLLVECESTRGDGGRGMDRMMEKIGIWSGQTRLLQWGNEEIRVERSYGIAVEVVDGCR